VIKSRQLKRRDWRSWSKCVGLASSSSRFERNSDMDVGWEVGEMSEMEIGDRSWRDVGDGCRRWKLEMDVRE